MSAIVAEDISKHWRSAEGAIQAVDGLSFAFDAGTLNVLLGPSGCGKSTTLRLIAGLETADSGRITIAGRDVTNLPPAERNIAMVFQSYALFPHLSVSENIVFGLKVRNVAPDEIARRLKRIAELLGLTSLLDRKPSQLSGGQQQRVAVARALGGEPAILLADEPTGNLDSRNGEAVMDLLEELHREGATICMVTHDPRYTLYADRTIHLFDGKVVDEAFLEEQTVRS